MVRVRSVVPGGPAPLSPAERDTPHLAGRDTSHLAGRDTPHVAEPDNPHLAMRSWLLPNRP
jgi:hypothetical protein